jgi:hypothetical protein
MEWYPSSSSIVQVHYQAHVSGATSNARGPSVYLGKHSVTCNPHASSKRERFEPYYYSLPQRSPPVY